MASKIKVGDAVVVVSGDDKGLRGTIQSVDRKRKRVVVSGVNIVKKAQSAVRAGRGKTQTGIIEFEAPIHISNVMLVDPETSEPTRVGFRVDKDGSKVRIAVSSGKELN